MIVAGQYAHDLPVFAGQGEAETALFAQRDMGLREIHTLSSLSSRLDYLPESLKALEQWFFENGQPSATPSGYSMAHAVGFYFGEVLCRTQQFHWVVQEFVFSKGHYEVGVQRPLLSIMLTKGKKLQPQGNKRMQSLWREFQRYAP
ncbi:hypothetical protein CWO84_10070 [Methylomonas sp. Kb3]|uniref:hypothetical protein n=1 Tax=Methylomonas sp. Kb3 TaxID=1611544 RepID=UPI000C33727C|nr:hypothetical protein [Methylomonas sp. Kb3]PKD40476.1 hypothetical protein CWO84_10070 [Methylomonas sp. Kb3]